MARVVTRGKSLMVYSTPQVDPSLRIGEISTGVFINILETTVRNNILWGRFSSDGFTNAWVIVRHPAATYNYVDMSQEATEGSAAPSISSGTARLYAAGGDMGTVIATASQNLSELSESRKTDDSNHITSGSGVFKTPSSNKKTYEYTGHADITNYRSRIRTDHSIQNSAGFPPVAGFDSQKNRYVYNYVMDYSDKTLQNNIEAVRNSINLYNNDPEILFKWNSTYYNRFKVAQPNDVLSKTFPHVFFTRPDCAVLNYTGSGVCSLSENVAGVPLWNLRFKNSPEIVKSLVLNCGWNHEFMMYLSNKVVGFELKDVSLDMDTYGKTLRGNAISYGRNSAKSKGTGEVSITFAEDPGLHTLQIHELLIDYIDGVNTGRYCPDISYIFNKELDYAMAAYYILCGPDGETILYMAKFYGMFPLSVPSSILGYRKGDVVHNPEINISYAYSWVEPNSPEIMVDFNTHINNGRGIYEATYQPDILSTGTTWVGPPFIESVQGDNGEIIYKLRCEHISDESRMKASESVADKITSTVGKATQ